MQGPPDHVNTLRDRRAAVTVRNNVSWLSPRRRGYQVHLPACDSETLAAWRTQSLG
jgi:hypothetical protein